MSTAAGRSNSQAIGQVRGGSQLLASRVFAVAVNLVTQILIIRSLTDEDYGALAFVLSLTWIARNFATLGLHRTLPSMVSRYHERHDYPRLFGAITLQAGTIATLGFALWGALFVAQVAGLPVMPDAASRSLALILVLIVPLEALDYFLLESLMASFHRPRAIAIRKHIVGPLIKLGIVLAMLTVGAPVEFLAGGLVVAAAVGIALYLPLVIRMFREVGLTEHLRDGIHIPWGALAMAIPLLSADVMFAARGSLDAVLVQANHGFSAVADLRVVQPAANLNELVVANFALLFMPLASRLIERRTPKDLNAAYWQTAAWQIVLSLPLFLLTFSLATSTTVLIAGEQYRSSGAVLAILALGYFFSAVVGPSNLVLVAAGHVRYLALGHIAIAAINVALLFVLVPPFGPVGAAAATTLALVLQRIYEQVGLRRAGLQLVRAEIVRLALVAGTAGIVLLAIESAFQPWPPISWALAGTMVLLIVRANRRLLAVEQTFPELIRLPGAGLFFGSGSAGRESGSTTLHEG